MSDGLGGYYCKCNPNTTGKNCEQGIIERENSMN